MSNGKDFSGASNAISIIGDIAQLEPIAFGLLKAVLDKLKGKSDADILASDATDWAAIVIEAHDAAVLPPPK